MRLHLCVRSDIKQNVCKHFECHRRRVWNIFLHPAWFSRTADRCTVSTAAASCHLWISGGLVSTAAAERGGCVCGEMTKTTVVHAWPSSAPPPPRGNTMMSCEQRAGANRWKTAQSFGSPATARNFQTVSTATVDWSSTTVKCVCKDNQSPILLIWRPRYDLNDVTYSFVTCAKRSSTASVEYTFGPDIRQWSWQLEIKCQSYNPTSEQCAVVVGLTSHHTHLKDGNIFATACC